jgi:septum formation protein
VDETPEPGELSAALAARLARAKAEAVAASVGDRSAVVIGSDQVPSLEADILTKPGTRANTVAQLAACANKTVVFYTAVSVIDCDSGRSWHVIDVTEVEFGNPTLAQIERYVERERPYDCAGGFKAEGLGIVLFKAIRSNDPTALIGLPLIWLADMLRRAGLDPLASSDPSTPPDDPAH